MRFDPDRHHRVTVRLPHHSYQQGTYFVTLCSFQRQPLFSMIVDRVVELTDCGSIVEAELNRLQSTSSFVRLDTYVIMPDHVHAMIEIRPRRKSSHVEPTTPIPRTMRRFASPIALSLQSLIGHFKSRVTKQVQILRRRSDITVWQAGFYEHIVRDQNDLDRIRQYIANNPARWQQHDRP